MIHYNSLEFTRIYYTMVPLKSAIFPRSAPMNGPRSWPSFQLGPFKIKLGEARDRGYGWMVDSEQSYEKKYETHVCIYLYMYICIYIYIYIYMDIYVYISACIYIKF